MKKIEDVILSTLIFKGNDDLADLLHNCRYELDESGSYGSRLYSVLTTVVVYLSIEKLEKTKKLSDSEKDFIIAAFKVVYPVKDNSYEITSIEFLQDPNRPVPGSQSIIIPDSIEYEHWTDEYFRLFISHSSIIKELAMDIKTEIFNYGVSAFVAHEDIAPSKKWQNVIESSLLSCNGLLALLEPNFKNSDWCDQEVGIAYGMGKTIVPVNVGINPYGFTAKFQALKGLRKTIPEITKEIWKCLISNESSSTIASRSLVKSFCNSSSFGDAKRKSFLLEELKHFDDKMVVDLNEALEKNLQISSSFGVPGRVKRLIEAKAEQSV